MLNETVNFSYDALDFIHSNYFKLNNESSNIFDLLPKYFEEVQRLDVPKLVKRFNLDKKLEKSMSEDYSENVCITYHSYIVVEEYLKKLTISKLLDNGNIIFAKYNYIGLVK